jgi:hypothetical protein
MALDLDKPLAGYLHLRPSPAAVAVGAAHADFGRKEYDKTAHFFREILSTIFESVSTPDFARERERAAQGKRRRSALAGRAR